MKVTGEVQFDRESEKFLLVKDSKVIHAFSPEPRILLTGDERFREPVGGAQISEQKGDLIFTYADGGFTKKAFVRIENGIMFYRAEIYGNGQTVEKLMYGKDTIICENPNNVVRESIFVWAPDLYESLIPKKGKLTTYLSTLELKDGDSFMRGECGRFIMPPYVAAINTQGVSIGSATPEIPRSIQGLEPSIIDRKLSFLYDYQGAFSCTPEGASGPVLMLYLAANPDDVIDIYTNYIFKNGISKEPEQWEDWWGGPVYCTIGDQAYEAQMETGVPTEVSSGIETTCNEKFLDEMMKILEEKDIDSKIILLDAGWMRNMVLFDVNEERFPDMRGLAARMREQGKHIVLWMAPFNTTFHMAGDCEFIFKEHPDWMICTRDGKPAPYLDYTIPEVRELMESRIHYMLSADEGCLDCDGLKVDFYYHCVSDQGFIYHDPSYGTGELLQYKILKLIYDAAKRAKPWAFIECSSANPLFNDTQDACRLNDDLTNNKATYEKRCWVTVKSRCNIPDTDDWWSYMDYFVPLTLEKCVFGIPALYAVKYRGVQGELISGWESVALGGNPINIKEADYRRVSAIYKVYANCPTHLDHKREIDLENRRFARYHTKGRLSGFPAAGTLCKDTVLFTCSQEGVMKACAIRPTMAMLPVPQGAAVSSVVITDAAGNRNQADYHIENGTVKLCMEDSGEARAVYEIVFS